MNFKNILSNFFSNKLKVGEKRTYLTSTKNDKKLKWGMNSQLTQIGKTYIVLSKEERARKIVRPSRQGYVHKTCNLPTSMSREIPETYTSDPEKYGYTYCSNCQMYRPISEFLWEDADETVGS